MSNKDTLIIYNAYLEGLDGLNVIHICNGYIAEIYAQQEVELSKLFDHKQEGDFIDAQKQLLLPGLIETHIHLDKACIASRCSLHEGSLTEAITQTALAKKNFSYQDIYQRGEKVIKKAILHGTSYMRTHVEIDPIIGLVGFKAIQQLKLDYAWAIELQICVFPQEGLNNNPGTYALLEEALRSGADLLGGCPYTDTAPNKQIASLFLLAKQFDVDLDFHLDFDLEPSNMGLTEVIKQTKKHQYQNRVTVGHVTKLSALPPAILIDLAKQMAQAGIQVTVLPSTDLFLTARDSDYLQPRGVAPIHKIAPLGVICSISSNNIENPFTPFGDVSQIRQANLYANVAQLATNHELKKCMEWVSSDAAKILNLKDYGLAIGKKADIHFYESKSAADVIATISLPTMGMKAGRITYQRDNGQIIQT
ncbi:amidohydrolase family protein [Marinomonas epiphytica]